MPKPTFEFDGIQLRAEALKLLGKLRGRVAPAAELARERGAIGGSTSNTLQRMAELGLLDVSMIPGNTPRYASTGMRAYTASEKGLRLLAESERWAQGEEMDDWPKPSAAGIVAAARRSQPTSVFDIPRVMFGEAG